MARTIVRAHGTNGRDDSLIVGRHRLADRMLGIVRKNAAMPSDVSCLDRAPADRLIKAYGGHLAILGAGCDHVRVLPGALQFWFVHKRFDIVRTTLEPSELARVEIGAFSLVTRDFEPLVLYEGLELTELRPIVEHETGLSFVAQPIIDATPACETKNADAVLNPKPSRGWLARLLDKL